MVELLLFSYLIVLASLALWSRRKNQGKTFRDLAGVPDSPTQPTPRRRVNAVFALVLATCIGFFALYRLNTTYFSPRAAFECAPSSDRCWIETKVPCRRECWTPAQNSDVVRGARDGATSSRLPAIGATLPWKDDQIVTLRALRPAGVKPSERIWAFERYTRSGKLLATSFYLDTPDPPRLSRLGERYVKVAVGDGTQQIAMHVYIGRGEHPDRINEYVIRDFAPESWKTSTAEAEDPLGTHGPAVAANGVI